MSSSRRLLLCPAVALVAALAACSGGAPEAEAPTSAAPVTSSVSPSPTPTPSPTAVIELSVENFEDTLAAAYADVRSYAFAMTGPMDEGVEGDLTMSGVARMGADGTPEIGMTAVIPGTGTLELRIVSSVWYMSMGEATAGKFIVVDPTDPDGPAAGFGDVINAMDPGGAIAGATVLSVAPSGRPEVLDGVLCQRFEVVVDGSTAASDATAQTDVPPRATLLYWVGADALVRKVSADEANGGPFEITFSKWGEPVDLQAPGSDQIITLDDLGTLDTE